MHVNPKNGCNWKYVFLQLRKLLKIKKADERWLRESFSLIGSDFPREIQIYYEGSIEKV